MTYHDPCYIGRYNGVYDQPRRVLNVLNSNGVTEMRRNRNKSFCCGGGGGRVWMEEKIGKRVNQTRVNEALETNAEVLAAAVLSVSPCLRMASKVLKLKIKCRLRTLQKLSPGL